MMLLWTGFGVCAALAADAPLPVLERQLPPAYPAEALARGESAAVLLELDVRPDGSVSEARVVESAGPAFDAAAVQAAASFQFSPPLDVAGRSTAITLRYRTVFEPQAAPPLSVEGRVLKAGTREAVDGLELTLQAGERSIQATTDGAGAFRVAGLEAGPYTVSISARGYRREPVQIEVRDGSVAQVTLYGIEDRPWEVEEEGVSESVLVVGRRVTPEITERILSSEDARTLPGTGGDIVRVVQNLPGVARPPLNIGQLLIRGTAPEDSAYYLDGAQIPLVFHFGGLSTVLNGDAIAEIAYLPGNYGVRYGRTVGGVVDLRVDTELPERSRGYLSVDLFQTTAFVEQDLGGRAALTLSGRRSYVDAVLNPILNGAGGEATVQAPRYYDLQLRLLGKTRRGGSLDTLFLLSDDRFEVIGPDADDEDQVQIGLTTTFQKLRMLSREELGRGWRNEASFIAGPERQAFALAGGEAYEAPFTVALREEVFRPAPEGFGMGLRTGVDAGMSQYRFLYDIPGFGAKEEANVLRLAPAVYAEPTVRLGRVEVVPGVRLDGLQLGAAYAAWAVDPRLAARLDLGTTALKASGGGYSQWPTVRQALENPELTALRSWQASTGVEQRLGPEVGLEVTGYVNRLAGLVSGREDAFRFFSGPPPIGPLDTDPYANDGTGSILGVEALLRWQSERTTAWLSTTISRSTRVDRPADDVALFEYDQPVVVTALASQALSRGWRLGARVRYGSGNPYTPVVNRFFDLDGRTYRPVYGELDSERLPGFWQVDVRVDKKWVYRNWALTAYLDLQNATNAQNVEVMAWTFDYAEEDPITQIPLVPAFGLRGEW